MMGDTMHPETHAELIVAAIEAIAVDHAAIGTIGPEAMDAQLKQHRQQLRDAITAALSDGADPRVLRKLG